MELKDRFFYKNWWLFYLLFFLLLGLLFYALFWRPVCHNNSGETNRLKSQNEQLIKDLNNCKNAVVQNPVQNPAPNPNDSVQIVNCNAQVNSGGKGDTETQHSLGAQSGRVVINYDAKRIPDRIDVYYDGKVVATTGADVPGVGQLVWNYPATPGKPDYCTVVVSAPQDNTNWEYQVNCPQ